MSNLPPHELERLLARQKSYTNACVVVIVLYLVFWFPGFVANYLYCQDAKRMEAIAGERLPGVGLLQFLLMAQFCIIACVVLGFFVLLAASRG